MKVVVLVLFLLSLYVYAQPSCDVHPLYCTIKKINPSLKDDYVMRLSNIILSKSQKYNIDKYLIVAKLAQESMFTMGAKGYKKVKKTVAVEHNDESYIKTTTTVTIYKVVDYGISQININNIKHYKMNIDRLMNDMDYAVDRGVFMLSTFLKYKDDEPFTWWSRYNAGSKTDKRTHLHDEYHTKICAYYYGDIYCTRETLAYD